MKELRCKDCKTGYDRLQNLRECPLCKGELLLITDERFGEWLNKKRVRLGR